MSQILVTKTYKNHTGECLPSKPRTWQGSSMGWGGTNRRGAKRMTKESTLASAANTGVSRLANKMSRGLGCSWAVFYLASSIRIHLHAEV